ncbi:hypothetical protein [Cytobacillus praedii]|uniref:hypothetical protein n=1 Tax=Cytobacillus praedii TaxID=1742358 RepID=UPI002E2195FB|nr:hypothetical protein [Cytobacillus praedii]
MQLLIFLYLASILSGFALINVPTSAIITPGIANFFDIVGGIAIVVFSFVLLYHGIKSLIKK